MATPDDPSWEDSVAFLVSLDSVPAAQATGRLLRDAAYRWEGQVVPRTSMHDLLFTIPGQEYPFPAEVRVSWTGEEGFRFVLLRRSSPVTADHSHAGDAPTVLDSYLTQLVGEATSP